MANRHFPASIPVVELKALWDFRNGVGTWQDALDNGAWALGCLNAMVSSAPAPTLGTPLSKLDDTTAEAHWQSLTSPKLGDLAAGVPPWMAQFIAWLLQFLATGGSLTNADA